MATVFGDENVYGTRLSSATNQIGACKATLSEAGSVTSIHWYMNCNDGASAAYVACIHSDSAGSPDALLGTTSEVVIPSNTAAAWVEFDFVTPVVCAAADYWLGRVVGDNAWYGGVYYNTATGTWAWQTGLTYPTPPDPFNEGDIETNRIYSVHAHYTPTASGNPYYYYAQL